MSAQGLGKIEIRIRHKCASICTYGGGDKIVNKRSNIKSHINIVIYLEIFPCTINTSMTKENEYE